MPKPEPFLLIAGPCVLESEELSIQIGTEVKKIAEELGWQYVFKASYDKANRTSVKSFRGPGVQKGVQMLADIRAKLGVPVLTDVHSVEDVAIVASTVDILQIPAFLCRQTNMLLAAAKTGKIVNVKKGQFLAPWDMKNIVEKIESAGNRNILLTERGVSFGYNTLVSDFRAIPVMRGMGYPVVFDATHSVQQPGGLGKATGGEAHHIPLLARCGAAADSDALFMEVHENPAVAKSDGPNSLPLKDLESLLLAVKGIKKIVNTHA